MKVYVVYELHDQRRNSSNGFTIKQLFVWISQLNKKCNQNDCELQFDGAISWSFGNNVAGNIVLFGVDNSSSIHSDNRKNSFLRLGEDQLMMLMTALTHQKKVQY